VQENTDRSLCETLTADEGGPLDCLDLKHCLILAARVWFRVWVKKRPVMISNGMIYAAVRLTLRLLLLSPAMVTDLSAQMESRSTHPGVGVCERGARSQSRCGNLHAVGTKKVFS
jgi:hypothetical protein